MRPRRQHGQLGVGGVHVVGQHRQRTEQPVVVVGVDVVGPVGELSGDRGHLGRVLVDVRGEAGAVHLGQHGRARGQHRVGRGEREARRDGVAQPAAAVPVLREVERLGVRPLRRGEQRLGQHPVADDEPARDAQAVALRLREEQVDGRGEVRPEHQRRGGARGDQARDELVRDGGGVVGRGEVLLLRERAAVEPLQQRHAERTDHPHLGEVDVGVHQPRQQDPVAQVEDRRPGPDGRDVGVRAAVDDHAVVGDDEAEVVAVAEARPRW